MSIALHLVEPAGALQSPEARLNARLLAALLLTLLCLELVGALVITSTVYPASTSLALWGAAVLLLLSYALSRTRRYRWGAVLGIFIFSLIPYATIGILVAQLTPELLFLSLAWLSLPIVLTSVFFSTRITAVYALMINLSLLLTPVLIPGVDRTAVNTSLGLVLTVSVLAVALMYHHQQIERARQATLAESETRYRRLAENARDIIYRYNFAPQRRIAYINPAVSGILGHTPDEFYADPDLLFNLIHPDDQPALLSAIAQGVPLAAPLSLRWVRKDGTLAWIEHRNVPINDAAGNLIAVEGIARDITDRKQAEVQIERNMRQLTALEHMGQTIVASLDLAVVLTRVIEEISLLLGAEGVSVLLIEDRDELVFVATNRGATDELIGRRMPVGAGIAGEVVRTGQPVRVHDRAGQARIHRDIDQAIGFHTESLLAVPLNLRGEIIGVMEAVHTQPEVFSIDDLHLLEAAATWATVAITNARLFNAERRRVQEQAALLEITQMALSSFEFSLSVLKHIAQRIAQACHAFQCLLFLLEEQAGTIRPLIAQRADGYEDPDARQLLETLAAERLAAWPMLHTIVHERRPHLFRDARQTVSLPDEWKRLFGFERVLVVPLLSQGEAIGLMVVDYNTDQVVDDSYFNLALTIGAQIAIAFANTHLYADLQRSLQHERDARAQVVQAEKLVAIGRLAASVAHELNNPLQAIQNSLYLIRQESTLSQQSQDDLDVALAESQRMAELIDRMRETYRPTTATEFRLESLNELIAEVEKLIGTHLRHNEVIFEFRPDPHLPPVLCLRDQLKQVILNVSLNAVEAMPNGGQLMISTYVTPGAEGLWMTFADTGQGIAPEDLSKIFDPFFTRKAGGTGLGLAICYDIIQHHHGRIEVESDPGHGTTFRIWLPAQGS